MKIRLKRLPLKALGLADETLRSARYGSLRLSHKLGGFSSAPFPGQRPLASSPDEGKGRNSYKKLEALRAHMPSGVQTVLDIGSNNGFFSIHLALEGYDVIGYEPVTDFVRGATQVCERMGVGNAAFIARGMDIGNSRRLFHADATLVLSVFHNWVKQSSFTDALTILSNIWAHTRNAMFFELADTVDNTYIAGFDTMPRMGSTVQECTDFIAREILGKLEGAEVEFLGMMPTDYRNGSARHLFIVRRVAP